ncbi:FadR/GntR family transcriptional regulator [Reichenbachiella sp.]|uniref:FadR/GntR family transcriptional regulator n=1 Tax=Reichenbachiella sp. TaxID=2184521 RepID=UPI003B5B7F81
MKISLIDQHSNKILQNEVIGKIRDLINLRNLERGDKLPSERMMSEKFEVKRNHIREAIRKLEFYGVVKSVSQSGTILAIGLTGFNGMVDEIISLNAPSFQELVETRISLELEMVGLAAQRRTDQDLEKIKDALDAFKAKLANGENYLEEDLLFHLAIAKASKNSTMISLMLLLIPPILSSYERDEVCEGDEAHAEIKKHEDVFLAIQASNASLATEMMHKHFFKLSQYLERSKA